MQPRTSSGAGNGSFWNIHRTHPIWVHAITMSSPKWKNHCDGPSTTQEINVSVLSGGQYGTSAKMGALMVYDAFQTFGNRWQIRGRATILKVHKCCFPVNEVMSEISNHYFSSNPCVIRILKRLQKMHECFTSKPKAHETFWNSHIDIKFKKLISLKFFNINFICYFQGPDYYNYNK